VGFQGRQREGKKEKAYWKEERVEMEKTIVRGMEKGGVGGYRIVSGGRHEIKNEERETGSQRREEEGGEARLACARRG